MRRFIISLLGLALAFVSLQQVEAGPVQWRIEDGGNGHWYEAVLADESVSVSGPIVVDGITLTGYSGGITWTEARDDATAKGGLLVDITSAAENSFAYNLVNPTQHPEFWFSEYGWANEIGPWIGGFQPEGSPEPGGNWQWVTGNLFTYTDWIVNQPGDGYQGDTGISEDAIHFYDFTAGWNDYPSWTVTNGYVIEWDGISDPIPGDANYDLKVNVTDLGILAMHFGTTSGAEWGDGDFTGEGVVNVNDLGILATNYGYGTATATPEPGTMTLIVFGVIILLIRRRK